MKRRLLLLIFLPLLCTSCTKTFTVLVQFLNLEYQSDNLELKFNFMDHALEELVNISSIQIRRNDSILYKLETTMDTVLVSQWRLSDISEGFEVVYPANVNSLPQFSKTDNLSFWFLGTNGSAEWQYKPSYFDKEKRWMFDRDGNKTININSYYETHVGRDVIKIYSNVPLGIDNASITLVNSKGKELDFEIRLHKDNDKLLFLTLEEDLKGGEEVNLTFRTQAGNNFSETIIAKGKSNIGLIGKYQ